MKQADHVVHSIPPTLRLPDCPLNSAAPTVRI